MSATGVICIIAPLHIKSEANGREHHMSKARRVKAHRHQAALLLRRYKAPAPPATITLTRIAPRDLDDDNLASGFKATRDGVADWLGINDGDKRLTWRYGQRRGKPKEYAAEITVEWQM